MKDISTLILMSRHYYWTNDHRNKILSARNEVMIIPPMTFGSCLFTSLFFQYDIINTINGNISINEFMNMGWFSD